MTHEVNAKTSRWLVGAEGFVWRMPLLTLFEEDALALVDAGLGDRITFDSGRYRFRPWIFDAKSRDEWPWCPERAIPILTRVHPAFGRAVRCGEIHVAKVKPPKQKQPPNDQETP